MIRLNVFISVNDENRTKVLAAAKELTAASVQEEGCIAYDILKVQPALMCCCFAKHGKTTKR